MNKNKKIIIIVICLLILLISFLAIRAYQKKQNLNKEESVLNTEESLSHDSNQNGFTQVRYFNDEEEVSNFLNKTFAYLLSKSREETVICRLNAKGAEPMCCDLRLVDNLSAGQYINIAVNTYDLIKERYPEYLKKKNFYICDSSFPPIVEHLLDSDAMEETFGLPQSLYFSNGLISCNLVKELEPGFINFFIGVVPNLGAGYQYSAKVYLVDQSTANKVMNSQSFWEGVNFLNNQPVLWQLNLPVVQ